MRISDISESVGRIVKGVNTTRDVDIDEISTQAIKFGNHVTNDGVPPVLNYQTIRELFDLGLTESQIKYITEAAYAGNIGIMELFQFFSKAKQAGTLLHEYVSKLTKSTEQADKKLAWAIIQNYLNVQLQGDEFKLGEPAVTETTTSGSIASVAAVPGQKKSKRAGAKYNKDGTIKNAADCDLNIFSGTKKRN